MSAEIASLPHAIAPETSADGSLCYSLGGRARFCSKNDGVREGGKLQDP